MEPLPVRHMHYAIGGAARQQRLLAVACASLYCADRVMASEIHGDETRYPTVTYADTDVSHTDVSRQVLRNLRISPPFRPGSGAWLPHWQPSPPAGSKHAPALPRGDDPQRTVLTTDDRSSPLLSKLCWILIMAIPLAILSFVFCMTPARHNDRRAPPSWDPANERTYSFRAWLTDVSLWTVVSDLSPQQQAASIVLTLEVLPGNTLDQ